MGEVALLSEADPPVAIGQRVVLLQPKQGSLDSRFLRLVLMGGAIRRVIAMASAGSLHPHLNMADISRLRVPGVELAEQSRFGSEHEKILETALQGEQQLQQSIDWLAEYKQSLITAAVTGELDVTTAGSGIPG